MSPIRSRLTREDFDARLALRVGLSQPHRPPVAHPPEALPVRGDPPPGPAGVDTYHYFECLNAGCHDHVTVDVRRLGDARPAPSCPSCRVPLAYRGSCVANTDGYNARAARGRADLRRELRASIRMDLVRIVEAIGRGGDPEAPDELLRLAEEACVLEVPADPQGVPPRVYRGLDTGARVRFYEHEFYVLSNFSAFRLAWKGLVFETSEHAYHWEKFPGHARVQEAIRTANSAHDAFRIARQSAPLVRPGWDEVKVGVMREILRAKVAQHPYVWKKLLETGDRDLVEDSWRDDFWGWGPSERGWNVLGVLWQEVRAEVRAGTIAPSSLLDHAHAVLVPDEKPRPPGAGRLGDVTLEPCECHGRLGCEDDK